MPDIAQHIIDVDDQKRTTPTTNTLSLTDLIPGTEYEVRVRAKNDAGASAFTAWTRFTTTGGA